MFSYGTGSDSEPALFFTVYYLDAAKIHFFWIFCLFLIDISVYKLKNDVNDQHLVPVDAKHLRQEKNLFFWIFKAA